MKFLALAFAAATLMPTAALAEHRRSAYTHRTEYCQRFQVREEYIPGRYDAHGRYQKGYVQIFRDEAPCWRNRYTDERRNEHRHHHQERYEHSSSSSCRTTPTVLGGLLGGGIAAGISKPDAYVWSVPVGAAVGGALIGCT
jgi:hypothetical protein